ncbi:MAG: hypothetical protein WC565_03220 [Parcubacteria group bacterium]|jgi:hypothetical protein
MAHRLADLGKLIVKRNPNGGVYFAKESFPEGVTPEHLKPYTERFTAAARECATATKGMPAGMEHPKALRACIGQKLGK